MSRCYYEGTTNRGREDWGRWVADNVEDAIVQHCRWAFNDKYRDMWIDPIYFDDKYFKFTENFYPEVGVALYPKITDLKFAFAQAGIAYPRTRGEWDLHRAFVKSIVVEDIYKNKRKGVKPIYIVVNGVRMPCEGKERTKKGVVRVIKGRHGSKSYCERITSVKRVSSLPEREFDDYY